MPPPAHIAASPALAFGESMHGRAHDAAGDRAKAGME